MELYLLLISPFIVWLIRGPWQALLNLVLILMGLIPGLIHLIWIIGRESEYRYVERIVRHVKRANRKYL